MTGLVGAVATLALHLLFIGAALWSGVGSPLHPDQPDAIGAGANVGKPEGETSERRMTIQLLTLDPPEDAPNPMESLLAEVTHKARKLEIAGPDALPLPPLTIQEDGEPAESSDAELMARTKLAGVYESQIRARIERAWTLPAESLGEPDFSCRATIRQQRDGRIKEVEIPYEGCGRSAEIRQSVVSAIFTASPLPAPPHPSVFVDTFSIDLRSDGVRERSRQSVIPAANTAVAISPR